MLQTTSMAGAGTGHGAAEVAKGAGIDALWRRRLAVDEATLGLDGEARLHELDYLDEQITAAEAAILSAPVIDDRDALAVAITTAFVLDPGIADNESLLSCERGTFRLLGYLSKRAGITAADVGLDHYWNVLREAPARRCRFAAREVMEAEQTKRTVRARLDALRATVPAGALMAVHSGQFVDFYGDDARLVAATLGIVLHTRPDGEGGTVECSGVPAHSFDGFRSALEAAGPRVAVVDANA